MKKMSNIPLFLIVLVFVLLPPLKTVQAKSCCLKHSKTCSMHTKKTDNHCKGNTHSEMQCCEDRCYPNSRYTMSEKPSNNVHDFQALLNLSLSDNSIASVFNHAPILNFTFLEDFQRKKYSPPKLYLLKSSFLN
jgi:predicted dienelactone hydrolase